MHRLAELTIVALINLIPPHVGATSASAPALPTFLKPIAIMAPLQTKLPASRAELQTVYVPPPSYPVASAGSYANTYTWGNCTAYVASRIKVPDNWGNASTWAYYARLAGYTVSNIPLVGSIAQKTFGEGHVAIVEAVSGGQVEVTEMNVLGLGVVDTAWYPISDFQNYIYV